VLPYLGPEMIAALQDYLHDNPSTKRPRPEKVRRVRGFHVEFIYLLWRGPRKKAKVKNTKDVPQKQKHVNGLSEELSLE
jgi:hypothetical protein